ncbi:MAG: molybdenum cofactor guanylyltransferase [Deltaproteobacteria bacterium]
MKLLEKLARRRLSANAGRESVAVFILAGGKSERMGRDKRFMLHGGEPFIHHIYKAARCISNEVYVLISSPGDEIFISAILGDVPFIVDSSPGFGPLPALCGALPRSSRDFALLLSVDYPLMSEGFLLNFKELLESQTPKPDVLAPMWRGEPQVTCAFYRRTLAGGLKSAFNWGELSLRRWIETLPADAVKRVEERTWTRWAGAEVFFNVNTPEDYKKLTKALSA